MFRSAEVIATVALSTLLPLAAVAGVGTSTTTVFVTTTTTTIGTPPPGCADDASLDAIRCRSNDLAARVAASDDLGRFGTRVTKNLARADAVLERVERTCRGDDLRKARHLVKRAVRVMVRAGRALASGRARHSLDQERRLDLLTDVRALVRDLKRLRRGLSCPLASAGGAFV